MIVTVDRGSLSAATARASGALRAGQVVVLPTDTVYGLAALPTIAGATARLLELKGRTAAVPVAVLCSDARQALVLADPGHLTDEVRRIADRLWPGPLTLVLRRRAGLGYDLGEPASTVGLRCPDHDVVRAIAREVGPVAATSANRHGEATPPTAAEVAEQFGGAVSVVLDGGPCAAPASTVVDATGETWRVLRQGEVALEDIEAAARL